MVIRAADETGMKWFYSLRRFGNQFGLVLILGFLGCLELRAAETPECTPAQEYVSTIEYLRKQSHVVLDETVIRSAAEKVSQTCMGGARRFRESFEVLSLAELPGSRLLALGLRAAESGDERNILFLTVFKVSYARNGFDLSVEQALELAERLVPAEPKGGAPRVSEADVSDDFKKIALNCLASVKEGGWELPRAECARIAVDIVARVLSGRLGAGRAPDVLRNFVQFVSREKNGPSLALRDAIRLGDELLTVSDQAPLEYIHGWKYASKESGLRLPPAAAHELARKLALRATSVPPSIQKR